MKLTAFKHKCSDINRSQLVQRCFPLVTVILHVDKINKFDSGLMWYVYRKSIKFSKLKNQKKLYFKTIYIYLKIMYFANIVDCLYFILPPGGSQ